MDYYSSYTDKIYVNPNKVLGNIIYASRRKYKKIVRKYYVAKTNMFCYMFLLSPSTKINWCYRIGTIDFDVPSSKYVLFYVVDKKSFIESFNPNASSYLVRTFMNMNVKKDFLLYRTYLYNSITGENHDKIDFLFYANVYAVFKNENDCVKNKLVS